MRRHQNHQEETTGTGLRETDEAALHDEFQHGSHDTQGPSRTPPRPKWGLLYALFPLTILLFALADIVPETSGWRPVTETIAVLVVFGVLAAWVRANRSALALSQDESDTTSRH